MNFNFTKSILIFLISFVICNICGYIFIYISKKINLIQKPKNINYIPHKNTPSLGGVLIIISIIISMIIFIEKDNYYFYLIIFTIFTYGLLGFIDDYIKISKKNFINGLSIKSKYIFQSILAIIIILIILMKNNKNIFFINFPFIGKFIINKKLFFIKSYFTIIGSCNSTNISDGLDGLSIKVIINIILFLVISLYIDIYYNLYYFSFNDLNNIINICLIILGTSLSFLWFNCYPAKIFMGDTGSLSLGSLIGVIYVLLNKDLFLIFSGFIFVIETISIIIQIIYFYLFKKKFFLISPLHHNLYIKGINESKIVEKFSIISILFSLIGLLGLINNY